MIDQAHYDKCLANGCSERLAEMLASSSPPPLRTATAFASRHGTIADQFKDNPRMAKRLASKYRRRFGHDLPYTHVYCPTLARPGTSLDPEAVVPSLEIGANVRRVAKARGTGAQDADGNWLVKPREPASDPREEEKRKRGPGKRLAKDLVEDRFRQRVQRDPQIAKLPPHEQQAVRQEIIDLHGSK